jgi:hypothetical protein
MNHHPQKQYRLLAIALTSRGLGYAVLEGEKLLVENGHMSIRKEDKNKRCLAKAARLIAFYKPDALVLQDVTAKHSQRAPRIQSLHRSVVKLAGKNTIEVELFSETQLRTLLLGDINGTKHQMAEMLAKHFPNELAPRLPPKRRLWESADSRMDIFDAAALAVAFRLQHGARIS